MGEFILLPLREHAIIVVRMRIISRKTLKQFWERSEYRDAEMPLRAWFNEANVADWRNPADVKAAYRSASIVGNDRIVFNIAGNKYRLVVRINYPYRVVYVRFVGTHRQYDRIDVTTV
jgi:mRNA interferase HigB